VTESSNRHVRVLHSAGCPGAQPAEQEARRAIARAGDGVEISVVLIDDEEAADSFGMHGSPTVTVDGVDVDPRFANEPASLHG
jgi:hypothetical protein